MNNVDTNIFRAELSTGERILWSGQPRQGIVFRNFDIFLIPFSLAWGGFIAIWELFAVGAGAPSFFACFGIPFVLVGLYFIFGRFIVDAQRRKKTYYALTNERILIISGLFSRNIRTLNLKQLPDINLALKGDGSGTITFGANQAMPWLAGFEWWGIGNFRAPSFELVEDARQVYELVRKTQREV